MRRALFLLMVAGGCIFQPSKGPNRESTPRDATSRPSPSPQKPQPHSLRFAWSAWNNDTTLFYCNRRLDDQGNQVGVIGPCFKIKENDTPHRLVAFTNVNRPETTPPNAAPKGCTIEIEDAQLVPEKKPARAWLVTASGKQPLEEWLPDSEGDVFVVETTPSPDGKLLGILRVAVGLGEGERTIEVPSARVIAMPACH
jgi:hypothetical protein